MSRIIQLILGIAALLVVVLIGVALWGAATGPGSDKAPALSITSPTEGAQVSGEAVTVRGKTRSGARVRVNNQPVAVRKDGTFQGSAPLEADQTFIFVKATYKGRDTIVQRSVTKLAPAAVPTVATPTPSVSKVPAAPAPATTKLSTTGPGDWLSLFGLAFAATLGALWRRSRSVA